MSVPAPFQTCGGYPNLRYHLSEAAGSGVNHISLSKRTFLAEGKECSTEAPPTILFHRGIDSLGVIASSLSLESRTILRIQVINSQFLTSAH